jgi:hypothetical protein
MNLDCRPADLPNVSFSITTITVTIRSTPLAAATIIYEMLCVITESLATRDRVKRHRVVHSGSERVVEVGAVDCADDDAALPVVH